MRRSFQFMLVIMTFAIAVPLIGGATGHAAAAQEAPESAAPGQPPAPQVPPVYVNGQAQGSEVVAVSPASGMSALLSVSWDGRRAAIAHWADDTNGDGAVDSRDYPVVSFFDSMTRKTTRLFAASDRVLGVQWADPDRVLVLKARPKASAKDARGDLYLRVIPTGRETLISGNVVWFDISPNGQQAMMWTVASDTNGDGNFNRSDAVIVFLLDLRQTQPAPVRVLSGFALLGATFAEDGFYYVARREDTNRDGRLNDQDLWRAYFYKTASWESKLMSADLRGSILRVDPSPKTGFLAMVEHETNASTGAAQDSLHIRRPDGGLVCVESLGEGREILSVQWSPTGERFAVMYRQAGLLGINPVGVTIYASDAKLLRNYPAVPLSGVSYPSFLWSPGGRGYIIERRTDESDDPRPTGKSQLLAAADLEPAVPICSFDEPSTVLAWTGAGILFKRYPESAASTPISLFARFRFSGSLAVFEPLTIEASGFKLTVRPSCITTRAVYLRVIAVNEGDKENQFNPAGFTLTTAQGVTLSPLEESDLMADLTARATVDTLMQPYPVPAHSTYAGFLGFQLPSDPVAQLKLSLLDAKGSVVGEYLLECRSSLEIF